jgi:aminoglycoside phosphotransferase family enzyme/predicted kinase
VSRIQDQGKDQASCQEQVFAFLADPATHGGHAVKRIDTHAATVFLAGPRALKVKHAVRFPFLDYSTLEKRKQACEAEIEVNRPFAPELYRGVLAVTLERDGKLALGGSGTVIEWAVEMHRFDEHATLDHLARAGKIDADLADALARAVVAAHAKAKPADPAPWIGALHSYIDEHATEFAASPDLFPAAEVAALAEASRAAYGRNRELLTERGERGLVRHIHGDLHLQNVVLLDGRPVLFDAIEFSPLIASGDLLYDLAFLLMDLCERGLASAANVILNRYLAETRRLIDLDALALLPFYLSMRAAIRAKVTAERLQRLQSAGEDTIAQSARTYFDWASRLIRPPPALLLAIGGLSGTGKSALARGVAPGIGAAPGAVVLRSDAERKALFGRAEHEPLPPQAYAPEASLRVFAVLADKARHVIAAGHCAVVDAVFAKPGERALMEESARMLRVPFRGLFLHTDLATRLSRVGGRKHDASDADAAVAYQQESYDLGRLGWPIIDAGGSPEDSLARAKTAISAMT